MTRFGVLRALEWLAWGIFFVFALFVLVLRYWALPNVERFRPDIVAAVSRGVGLQVNVGAIEADWRGLRPQIELSDVRIHDRDGREALVLPRVEGVVSWRSFAFMDLRMRSFTIDAPRLAVRRDAQGTIHVAGIRLASGPGDGALTDWILGQREIVIRDAEIEWTDDLRGAPPLALSSLQFRLANHGDQHDIGISARPPLHLGSGLDVRARIYGTSVAQPSAWNGRVYAELGYTDLAGWRPWVDYPADVRQGQGALRLWASLGNGRLTRAVADVALTGVVARLGRDLPLLEVRSVRGRVQGRETPRGYEFGARNLALSTAGGPDMRSTSFVALVEGDTPHRREGQFVEGWKPASGNVTANLIELAPLAHVAEFLPFPAHMRKALADLRPQGSVHDVTLQWAGEMPDATYKLRARFNGLGMNAWRRLPGFSGMSGSVEATERSGSVQLSAQDAELEMPRVFPEPRIALDALSGQLDWTHTGDGQVNVRLGNLAFANAHAAGSAFGTYAFTGEGPGVIDLTAQFSRLDGKHTGKYLPLAALMGARTRGWLTDAVQSGVSGEASMRLKGDLRDFPFPGGEKGVFRIAAKISKGTLDYTQGWPRLDLIEGELLFENERMEIVGRSGRILGSRVSNVRVAIPSLLADHRVLRIEGTATGPAQAFLDYVAQSPMQRHIGGATDGMRASGTGRLGLKLELPLDDDKDARVQGELRIANSTLVASSRLPPIEGVSGVLAFTESTFEIRDGVGRLFGGQATFSGGTQKEGGIAIVARGTFTPEGIRSLLAQPWRDRLSGSAPYVATLVSRDGRPQFGFESPLSGIAVSLPPPLQKAAQDAMPLRVEVVPGEGGERERVSITLATSLRAELLRAREGGELKLQRAAVSLNPPAGEALRLPERRGVLVYGTLPALDLDRWRPLMLAEARTGGGGGAASFDLRVGTLDAFGKRLRTVAMKGGADAGGWSANVNAAELAGDIAYRVEGDGKLTARLAYFSIPEDAPGPKSEVGASSAREFPAVDLVADSFTYRGRKLGRVEVTAEHDGPNWRIGKLAIVNPDSAMNGSGIWRPATQPGDAARTTLSFKVDSSDVGSFLDRMGTPDHIKGATAQIAGTLSWSGDPVTLDYPSLDGELTLGMRDGQFLEIEPGIGKLVSLMSLQMLPRRITLDFRDVFSKGFQFDDISAAFTVKQGIMATKNFRMKGPAAEVEIAGDVDLARETQRLQVKVIPELGSTASTVVGLVNPIAGVATMLAQRVLKNPLGQAFAFNYLISGGWADPKVEKLASGPIEPAPAVKPN
ncbi:MAG: YhdP family protein [Burkholderiales bacterium]